MGKRAKHVKVLDTKNTQIRVTTISGKPDKIEIWTKKDSFLAMKCPDMPAQKEEYVPPQTPCTAEMLERLKKLWTPKSEKSA